MNIEETDSEEIKDRSDQKPNLDLLNNFVDNDYDDSDDDRLIQVQCMDKLSNNLITENDSSAYDFSLLQAPEENIELQSTDRIASNIDN